MSARITVSFTVGHGYLPGDYAQLHGNGGSGAIDWDTPLSEEHIDLCPNRAGVFGWGYAPWGHFRWGHVHSMNTPGWGHLPWGRFPWGHGAITISRQVEVTSCGNYIFGLKCYDSAGNAHSGTPGETTVNVHIAPPAPAGLKLNSYNATTDVLTLDVA